MYLQTMYSAEHNNFVFICCLSLIYISGQAINDMHFTKHACVPARTITTVSFTHIASRVLCVSKCARTDQCVAVAVTGSPSNLQCANLQMADIPAITTPCNDVTSDVVVYTQSVRHTIRDIGLHTSTPTHTHTDTHNFE